MGANAQIAVPSFTAGQVLTAQQQTQINTGIPVFATTVTRDAAFGGSGEKVLAQGQTCYIEATSTYQTYNGSDWVTFGQSGLVVLKNETAFTTSSQIVCDTVFSSAYTFYKVLVRFTGTTTDALNLQFRVGGTAATTNYNFQFLLGTASSVVAGRNASQSSLTVGNGSGGSFFQSLEILIGGPAIAEATTVQSNYQRSESAATAPAVQFLYGNHSTATAYDGFQLTPAGGTVTGVYSVYGFSEIGA